jgi:PAS domain S-box-containing protein
MHERDHVMLPVELIRERVRALYQRGNAADPAGDVLERAFEELEVALEALQGAELRLQMRDTERQAERAELEQARQHYYDLFANAPAAYLITSLDGTIRQANFAAETLLRATEKNLVGRSLANFVPDGQRRPFRIALATLHGAHEPKVWQHRLQAHGGEAFDAILCAAVVRAPSGRPQGLRWMFLPTHALAEGQPDAGPSQALHQPPAVPAALETSVAPDYLFATLASASKLLVTERDLSTLLAQLAKIVVPALADCCVIDLDDGDGANVRLVVTSAEQAGGAPDSQANGDGVAKPQVRWLNRQDAADGDLALDDLPHAATLRALIRALAPSSAIVAPLQNDGQAYGSLTLVLSSLERRYGPADLALAEELARQLGHAVGRLRAAPREA